MAKEATVNHNNEVSVANSEQKITDNKGVWQLPTKEAEEVKGSDAQNQKDEASIHTQNRFDILQ